MDTKLSDRLEASLAELRATGLFKHERVLDGPQRGHITADGTAAINLCANNYLGLADHPDVVAAVHAAVERYGYGMASVRFICGTQEPHRALEQRLSDFLGTEDTILFPSCFDANGGVFEALLDEGDAVISDSLNHASIIDGIRLCKARRLRYANNDMGELEQRLVEAADARTRLIVTDGVFSMDGTIADLASICDLAERHDALVMVDDSHATGFVGATGRGTPEHCGVSGRVDIVTSTLGKALGGASGGFVAASAAIVSWLRQRARPYLFSNSVPPIVAAVTLRVLDLIDADPSLRNAVHDNARRFRAGMSAAGFDLRPGEHPIVPVMLGDAALASRMADMLLDHGVYVIGFSYPVVPMGTARIRTQMSAALSADDIDAATQAFTIVGAELGLIGARS